MSDPVEFDDLMWRLIDSEDSQAMADFRNRYPAHAAELDKRIKAVEALKAARPEAVAPLWQPTRSAPRAPSRALALALGFASCLALGAAFFARMQAQDSSQKATSAAERPSTLKVPLRERSAIPQPRQPTLETTPQIAEPPPAASEPPPRAEKGMRGIVEVRRDGARLTSVIQEVAQKAGIRAIFAPGFEDITVAVAYGPTPAIDVLKDLGDNFGFTVLEQGPEEVLVIPAVDPDRNRPSVGDTGFVEPVPHSGSDG